MKIKIDKCIQFKLPLEGYFVLHSLYNEEEDVLLNYIMNVSKIPTKVFKDLVNNGFLIFNGEGESYTLENIELTEKFGKEVLGVIETKNITFEEAFQQLREHYPIKTPDGRRLHQDIERCKNLYKSIVFKLGRLDVEKHSFILQCTNYIVNEKIKTNKLNYLKMLPTYLHQKEWTTVEDEVLDVIKKSGYVDKKVDSNGENKTIKGADEF